MYIKEPSEKAQAVVIWLHGLGSNYQDMQSLSTGLILQEPIKHVYLQAPLRPVTINGGMMMPAWYDIKGQSMLSREDLEGILESQQTLEKAIAQQLSEGFHSEQIYLAGFSQGAAVVLFTGVSYEKRLGGVACLSGYLPCKEHLELKQAETLPVFFGVGVHDDVVIPQWTQAAFQFFKDHHYRELILREYDMTHAVCLDELQDLAKWLSECIQTNIQRGLMSLEDHL